MVKRLDKRHPALVARAFGIEFSLLVLAAVVGAKTTIHAGSAAGYVVIALLAFAMEVRNAVVRRIAVPDLTTTVLTMTITGLAGDSRLAGGSGRGSVRRSVAVVAMLVGALGGALFLKVNLWLPLAVAAALALATWLVYVPAAIRLGR